MIQITIENFRFQLITFSNTHTPPSIQWGGDCEKRRFVCVMSPANSTQTAKPPCLARTCMRSMRSMLKKNIYIFQEFLNKHTPLTPILNF